LWLAWSHGGGITAASVAYLAAGLFGAQPKDLVRFKILIMHYIIEILKKSSFTYCVKIQILCTA